MSLRRSLRVALTILLPLSIVSTTYLYLYPLFNGCAFPAAHESAVTAFATTLRQHAGSAVDSGELAPFRLLTLADPQLEGDSSLPDTDDAFVPSLRRHWERVVSAESIGEGFSNTQQALKDVVTEDIPKVLQATRKRVDLFGNDYYLAHIYRTLHWWSRPTHVTVLGDLIGSQWVTDEEFERRGWRYWNRVFKSATIVEEKLSTRDVGDATEEVLGADSAWERRIVNVLGNHDAGYAGDMTPGRISRFERVFGKANWDIKFKHHLPNSSFTPTLHLVVLNSLNLDTPVLNQDLQTTTYEFINGHVITYSAPVEDRSTFTLLLTHLPLHKEAGVCVDAPFFDFYDSNHGSGVKEQNHLSGHVSSQGILQGIFGMNPDANAAGGGRGRNGVILTGHDHEGCDVWHHVPSSIPTEWEEGFDPEQAEKPWRSVKYQNREVNATEGIGIREVTLRSMMGSYGGNAGLFSAWWDESVAEWRYSIQMCGFGIQHWWWGVHVLDLITVLVIVLVGAVEARRLIGFEKSNAAGRKRKSRGLTPKRVTFTNTTASGEKPNLKWQRSVRKMKRKG